MTVTPIENFSDFTENQLINTNTPRIDLLTNDTTGTITINNQIVSIENFEMDDLTSPKRNYTFEN